MGLGILEPKTAEVVPGTDKLQDNDNESGSIFLPLKRGSGRNAHIVLIPQPSDDPNDPLNWSWLEKHAILLILCVGAIVIGAAPGPILQAGVGPVSAELGVSFTDATKLAGYVLLGAGSAGIFVSALSQRFGKRPLYIASSLLSVVGCIIGQTAETYSTLVVSRVVQGLGVSAYESLIIASIGDLFFVHERGPRIASVAFLLATITNGVLIIAGPITENLGWHYNFHILLPFTATQLLLVIFFVPETTYTRAQPVTSVPQSSLDGGNKELSSSEGVAEHRESGEIESPGKQTPTPIQSRKPYLSRLALYSRDAASQKSFFRSLLSPIVILFNVGALYTILISGIIIAWYIGVSVITSVVLSLPPYTMTPAGVGYASVAPVVGGIIGSAVFAVTSDPIIRYMSKKNNGVYEPEFRLPLMALAFVTCFGGLAGIGYVFQNGNSVYVMAVPWATLLVGVNLVAETTTGYALDAFAENATEIFIMNMLFKNFFYYGLTNYVIDWYFFQGPVNMFWTICGITTAMTFTTIPMYIYGKRYRLYWHKNNLIKKFGLDVNQL